MSRFLVGLIGEGILESLSPDMHMTEAAAFDLNYEYRIVDVREHAGGTVASLLDDADMKGYSALNITHPFKQDVLECLDELSEDAERIGAVNLVIFNDGTRRGENTDWTGFRTGLRIGLPDGRLSRVVQYGAGGAGAATAYALLRSRVAELAITDLDTGRAQELADRYQSQFPDQRVVAVGQADAREALRAAEGVVQATPVGMEIHPGVPFDLDDLDADAWVADVVYRPLKTALVRTAEARGHRVLDGGLMAVGQAADSFELITGLKPDFTRMRAHFVELLQSDSILSQIRGI